MVTRYENLSGVNANYIDGSFASLSQVAAGQSIMLLGTAEKGLSNTPFLVQDIGQVNAEFGKDSALVNLASQISDTTAANIFVTRIGGKQSHFLIEKAIAGSSEKETLLRISPVERGDASVFNDVRVALLPVTDGDLIRQRIVLFDDKAETVIFDSEEILSIDDTAFEVVIGNDVGEVLITKAEGYIVPTTTSGIETLGEEDPRGVYTISELPLLSELVAATLSGVSSKVARLPEVYVSAGVDTFAATIIDGAQFQAASIGSKEGKAGDTLSHCERFAAMESAYADLEDAGIDFMYCDGCYADVSTIPSSGLTNTEMSKWDKLHLGTAHKAIVQGQPYVTMFASQDPFNDDHVVTAGTVITHGDQTVKLVPHAESVELGLLLTLNDIRFEEDSTVAQGSLAKEEFISEEGRLVTVIKGSDFNSPATLSCGMFDVVLTAPTVLAGGTITTLTGAGNIDLKSLIKLNGDSAGAHDVSKAVLTHFDLTGELVPDEAVDSLISLSNGKYVLAEDAYAREVNFAHQAGSMAFTSSTEYKATLAFVPTTRARGGLRQLNRWAGTAPEYSLDVNGDLIVNKNGTGLMGLKFLYGNSSYRQNEKGNGLAYGGLIKTIKGFGIDSSDEDKDSRDFPIDLGKHVVVVGAHGVVPVQGTGRNPSFTVSNLAPKLIQRLAEMPVNEEPIGPVNGILPGVSTTGAINSRALLNDIALGRVTMVGTDGSIANLRTAALPSSDYTRVSTIRAANLVLDAVRSISLRYLGRSFSDAQLAALDAELAGTMQALKVDGSIQDGVVQTSASRLDRINGRLNLKVQFVPPLSIEAITVDLTVSAPNA